MTKQASSGDDSAQKRRSGAAQRAYEKRTARARASSGSVAVSRGGEFKARIPFVAAIIGLFSIGLAVTLLLTTRSAEDSYQLSDARAFNQSLVEQKAALERDFQSRNSAPELAVQASALGMVPANDPARLVVHPDGRVEVIGTPAPVTAAPMPPLDAPVVSSAPLPTVAAPTRIPVAALPTSVQNQGQSEQLIAVTSTTTTSTMTSVAVPSPTEDRR